MLNSVLKLVLGLFVFSCVSCKFFTKQNQSDLAEGPASAVRELIDIDNTAGGLVRVSLDNGANWRNLGKVVIPYNPREVWFPVTDAFKKIPYYNLIQGPSNVMVVDPTVIHLRINNRANANQPMGLDILPLPNGIDGPFDAKTKARSIVTDIAPGTSLFSGQFSPDIGASLFVGFENIEALSSDNVQRLGSSKDNHLRIKVLKSDVQIESITFENKPGGNVALVKQGGARVKIATMHTPITGTGRFTASAFNQTRGAVISQGVAHLQISVSPLFAPGKIPALNSEGQNFDPNLAASLKNEIAGFEITTADHFVKDVSSSNPVFIFGLLTSMLLPNGEAAAIQEGTVPLFFGTSLMAEGFRTQFSFNAEGEAVWFDIDNAKGSDKFVDPSKLVGVSKTAFGKVAAFRFVK